MAEEEFEVEETEVEEEQPPAKSRKKLFVVLPVMLIIFGVGGFFAYQKFLKKVWAKSRAAAAEKKVEAVETVWQLDPFTVNLADAGGLRYLRVEISLGLDKELPSKGKEGDPVLTSRVRDAILSALSTKKSDDLLTPEGKQRLREEIEQVTAPVISKAHVTGVFFTDFMVQ